VRKTFAAVFSLSVFALAAAWAVERSQLDEARIGTVSVTVATDGPVANQRISTAGPVMPLPSKVAVQTAERSQATADSDTQDVTPRRRPGN